MKMLSLIMVVSFVSLLAFVGCSGDSSLVTDDRVNLSVAIGETDSQVSVTNSIKGNYSLYTSSNDNCDIATYATCADGEFNLLDADTPATLSKLTQSSTKDHYFALVNANNVSVKKTISFQKFSARYGHQVVVLGSTMYLIGGWDGDALKNDVWSSTDGAAWTLVTNSAGFSGRKSHQVAVLGNTMYLIGGWDRIDDLGIGNGALNDVWSSTDGADWTKVKENDNAGFSARRMHRVAVLGSTMYLIGGFDANDDHRNDVWSSTDGAAWTKVKENAGFSARFDHEVAVLGNTMYVIGGGDDGAGSALKNDVWSSPDGAAWTKVKENAGFSARYGHEVAVLGNTMYVIAGTFERTSDVWSSTDGANWEQVTTAASFSGRTEHQVAVLGNTMYVIGGKDGDDGTTKLNDVWSSTDGANWTKPDILLSFDYENGL